MKFDWSLLGQSYQEFAVTSLNHRGHRTLVCPLGYTYSLHVSSPSGTWWRCNTTSIDMVNGKPKRCQLRVRTKLINGYEMIENLKHHRHQPKMSFVLGLQVILTKKPSMFRPHSKCWTTDGFEKKMLTFQTKINHFRSGFTGSRVLDIGQNNQIL